MSEHKVWTFFYGSYMNLDILKKIGIEPGEHEVVKLAGYDIVIHPLANLIEEPGRAVYGIVASVTHTELKRLYRHAAEELGGKYLPEPVVVEALDKRWRPAFCYIAREMAPAQAKAEYADIIIDAARHYEFPDWYIEHLESFRH